MKPTETPFLGIAYTLRSKTLADQRLINLYPEIVEGKSGSAQVGGFYGCPGLDIKATVSGGAVRGLRSAFGFLYAVSGNNVYELDTSLTPRLIGTIGTTTGPVTLTNNATQLGIFDRVGAHSYGPSGYAPIALPFTGAVGPAAYLDGFTVVVQQQSQNIWQSNLNDLTTWDALNFGVENGSADNVVSVIEFHNQLAIMKDGFTCFYIDAGNTGFVFQRLQGVYPEVGILAPYSVAVIDEAILWLGTSERGGKTVYIMPGYEPNRISTHAIEYAIDQYPTVDDAIGFAYSQEGHRFYLLNFPSANAGRGATWCLDLTATKKMGVPAWHERAGFTNGLFKRFKGQCYASFNGMSLVGGYDDSNIYALNLDTYTDADQPRKWLRSWRALPKAQYEPTRFNFLELNYESGIGVPPGTDPLFTLRYSDDSFNWTSELYGKVGQLGDIGATARWNRLGMTRRGVNSDRIFELSSTDPFKVALLGATIG